MDVLAVTICGACFVVLSFRLCPQACTGFVRAFKTISYTEQFQHTCMYRQNSDGGHISAQCTAHRNKINHSYPTRKPKRPNALVQNFIFFYPRPSIHPSIHQQHPSVHQTSNPETTDTKEHTHTMLTRRATEQPLRKRQQRASFLPR